MERDVSRDAKYDHADSDQVVSRRRSLALRQRPIELLHGQAELLHDGCEMRLRWRRLVVFPLGDSSSGHFDRVSESALGEPPRLTPGRDSRSKGHAPWLLRLTTKCQV
jgi:hypothetical protein